MKREALTQMTKKQLEALAKLKAAQPFVIVQKYGQSMIDTGVNTRVLWSLVKLGCISCSSIYLGGLTGPDLKVLK